jgi:predicted nucleic-acid-binding protein
MLAIDPSVIVRYLVGDDPVQGARARRLIEGNDVFVGVTVILETEWVLRSVYGFAPQHCAKALADFAGLARVTVGDAAAVAQALAWAQGGMDFADALHLAKAAGCAAFVSFDREFAKAAQTAGGIKVRAP